MFKCEETGRLGMILNSLDLSLSPRSVDSVKRTAAIDRSIACTFVAATPVLPLIHCLLVTNLQVSGR